MNFRVGQTASISKVFSYEEVRLFAELSGDKNPIHLDSDYAKLNVFKKPIVHGMLVSSLTSSVLANNLPGPGTIYLGQSLKFFAPVYHGDELTAEVEIINITSKKQHIFLHTEVKNQNNVTVISGEARVKI
jgi:3-hydroxybutyryl-CoA dehydratase